MAKFYVEVRVDFSGEIEAANAEEAEKLAYTSWGDTMDKEITYESIYSIAVTEIEEEMEVE